MISLIMKTYITLLTLFAKMCQSNDSLANVVYLCYYQQLIYCSSDVYMAASECSRDHFISEKYKTVPLFKLHFIQNSPLVHLCQRL